MLSENDQQVLSTVLRQYRDDAVVDDVQVIRETAAVADGASIYLLSRRFVLLVAPEMFPDAMAEQVDAMSAMATGLSAPINRVFLPLLGTGRLGKRSFMILPRCTPLGSGKITRRIDAFRMRGPALQWLRDLASLVAPDSEDDASGFCASLSRLTDLPCLGDDIRTDADRLIDKLARGAITARHLPMHGDLWTGNLLRDDRGNLSIIDWGGSTLQGFGIYDLIRLADSLNIRGRLLRSEIAWHRSALGQGADGPNLHLLGALGHFAGRLGEFPLPRYAAMAQRCYADLLKHQS